MAIFIAEPGNLAEIRRFVNETAQHLGADQAAVDDTIQAVDEAAANIIFHGYAGKPGMLEIDVTRVDASLVVCLRDQAAPFDPTRIPAPDLTTPLTKRRPGGLGIYLIHKYVDRVQYRVSPQGGNELTLIKQAF